MLRFIFFFCLACRGLWGSCAFAYPPDSLPQGIEATVERRSISYAGKHVSARVLRVQSVIPVPIDSAWAWVQTPALLEFVAKGRVRFVPEAGAFPARWHQGDTVGTRMRLYGFLPFGGVHWLYIETVDHAQRRIATREWDRAAKVWNHQIRLQSLGPYSTLYTDEIVIYGGAGTGLITWWARGFYRHRQRRWQKLAMPSGPMVPNGKNLPLPREKSSHRQADHQ